MFIFWLKLPKYMLYVTNRAVASLTVPGGQKFHFPHFSSNFDQFILFFLKLYSFSSSFLFSGWAARPPGKALATPLVTKDNMYNFPQHLKQITPKVSLFFIEMEPCISLHSNKKKIIIREVIKLQNLS